MSCSFFNCSVSVLFDDFSIGILINISTVGSIVKGDNFEIFLNNDKTVNFSYSESGVLKSVSSVNDVVFGELSHIAVSGEGDLNLYFNGNPENSVSWFSGIDSSNGFVVGEGLTGKIDELMIFNRGIALLEVESIYNSFIK